MAYVDWLHMQTPHLVSWLCTGPLNRHYESSTGQNFHVSQMKRGAAAVRRELLRAATADKKKDPITLLGLVKLELPDVRGSSKKVPSFVHLRKRFYFHWKEESTGIFRAHSQQDADSLYQSCFFSVEDAMAVLTAMASPTGQDDSVQDPTSSESALKRQYMKDQKVKLADCLDDGKILEAYHFCLPIAVLEDRGEMMASITRMLRSHAESLRHLRFESRVLRLIMMGFAEPREADTFKGKVSKELVQKQILTHVNHCRTMLRHLGDTFMTGASVEIMGSLRGLESSAASTDENVVHEAVEHLNDEENVLKALISVVTFALHSNNSLLNSEMEIWAHN
jgi:hypothetical protein